MVRKQRRHKVRSTLGLRQLHDYTLGEKSKGFFWGSLRVYLTVKGSICKPF